jgi:hypothetical protein
VSAEFRVYGIPCRRNSASTNSVSTEFRSTEFHVDGNPFQRGNSVSTEFRGHLGVHLVEKTLKSVFTVNIFGFFFFSKMR